MMNKFFNVFVVSFLLISLTGCGEDKVNKNQGQSPKTVTSTVTNSNATKGQTKNSSNTEKQNSPQKSIITSVAGVQFGSKPSGKETFILPGGEGFYYYTYEESINTNGSLLKRVTVSYTPITKQLFSIRANIGYHDLSKFADLISTKYNVEFELGTDHYNDNGNINTRGIIEQDYTSGSITIGDVKIFLEGNREIMHWDKSDYSRTSERKSKGMVHYVNERLYQIYLDEEKRCPQKLAADKEKAEAREAQKKREEQRKIEEQKKREREMNEL